MAKHKLRDKIKGALKKGEHVAAKITMFASRGAFLVAAKLNVFKLAKRLKQLQEKHPEVLEKFWYRWGGEMKNLNAEIGKGLEHMKKHQEKKDARHNRKHGMGAIDETQIISGDSELGEPYTVASVVAVCLPILTSILKVFNQKKTDKPGDDEHDKKNTKILKEQILKGGTVGVKVVSTDKKGKETVIDKGRNPPMNKGILIAGVGAVAVAGYFLLKKKK